MRTSKKLITSSTHCNKLPIQYYNIFSNFNKIKKFTIKVVNILCGQLQSLSFHYESEHHIVRIDLVSTQGAKIRKKVQIRKAVLPALVFEAIVQPLLHTIFPFLARSKA